MARTHGQLIGSVWVTLDAVLGVLPLRHWWLSPQRTLTTTTAPPAPIATYVAAFAEERWYDQRWPLVVPWPRVKAAWSLPSGTRADLWQHSDHLSLEDHQASVLVEAW